MALGWTEILLSGRRDSQACHSFRFRLKSKKQPNPMAQKTSRERKMKAQIDSGEIFSHTGWRVSGMAHTWELLNPVRIPVVAIATNIRVACQISTFLPLIIRVKIAAAVNNSTH